MWLVRGQSMGATVTQRPWRVMYFQVSVVDQVLVLDPRDPPVNHTVAPQHAIQLIVYFIYCDHFFGEKVAEYVIYFAQACMTLQLILQLILH